MIDSLLRLRVLIHRRRKSVDLIFDQLHISGTGTNSNADTFGGLAGFFDLVFFQGDRFDLALHIHPDTIVLAAIDDAIVLNDVAMRSKVLAAFWSEQDARLAATQDVIVTDHIVGVTVTEKGSKEYFCNSFNHF